MVQDLKTKINVRDGKDLSNDTNYVPSTFAKVHVSKTSPIQSRLDQGLRDIIGSSFLLVGIEKQNSVDRGTGEVHTATIYTVRIISRKVKAFRELIQIKVKDSKPIVKQEEIDLVMMQQSKPIILRFENVAHYAYRGGETLNATGVDRLNVNIKDAMNYE